MMATAPLWSHADVLVIQTATASFSRHGTVGLPAPGKRQGQHDLRGLAETDATIPAHWRVEPSLVALSIATLGSRRAV